MLFDKPSGKCTGRLTFVGKTECGREVWGNFFRIQKKKFQIKAGEFWRTVTAVYVKEGNRYA